MYFVHVHTDIHTDIHTDTHAHTYTHAHTHTHRVVTACPCLPYQVQHLHYGPLKVGVEQKGESQPLPCHPYDKDRRAVWKQVNRKVKYTPRNGPTCGKDPRLTAAAHR